MDDDACLDDAAWPHRNDLALNPGTRIDKPLQAACCGADETAQAIIEVEKRRRVTRQQRCEWIVSLLAPQRANQREHSR